MNKSDFRVQCLAKIRATKVFNRRYKEHKMMHQLEVLLSNKQDILIYWPLALEADLRHLFLKWRRKKRLYLPFMVGKSFKMVPFRYPLIRGKFGILESKNSLKNIKKIDSAIIPAIGIDGQAKRIGFGKGMYDRFFASLSCEATRIFIQLEPCMSTELVCDDYDIDAQYIVTPNRCFAPKKGNHDKRVTLRRQCCHS